jgi:hypothetical protein
MLTSNVSNLSTNSRYFQLKDKVFGYFWHHLSQFDSVLSFFLFCKSITIDFLYVDSLDDTLGDVSDTNMDLACNERNYAT